ncbi:MAG: formylglycine-generating enzyme family protein, partial [Hyphomicrobiaceae bacterium]
LVPPWTVVSHGYFEGATHPVVCVSWSEAKQFSDHLALATGRPYRLPTEAEWEYAARAGSSSRYFFGEFEVDLCDYGNVRDMGSFKTSTIQPLVVACRDGSRFTSAVGSFKPNAFGLYDTIGNVWEWVEDCRLSDYNTANADGSAPIVPDCKGRVARGGSWGSHGANVRSAIRWFGLGAEVRFTHTGFRVARSAD